MNFSMQSVWDMTKLFVLHPDEASRRVLAVGLPVNVSLLMLVLAGILSGVMVAFAQTIYGASPTPMELPDGSELMIAPLSPLTVGIMSVLFGVIFSYLVYWVGARSSGRGSLAGVLSVMAALQIALTVIGVIGTLIGLVMPFVLIGVQLVILIVTFRGYGFATLAAHGFESMGRAIMVLLAALIITVFVASIVMMFMAPILMPDFISQLEALSEIQNGL